MRRRKTTREFIQDAIKVHGNKFGYNKVEYSDGKTKVIINCPEHGDFLMRPKNHLIGQECPGCGKIKNFANRSENRRKSKPDFSHIILPDGAKAIPVTKGKYTIVDEEDFDELSKRNWHFSNEYVATSLDGVETLMHRYIMQVSDPEIQIDHTDRNKQNNRRSNLRVCTQTQNIRNRPAHKGSSSKYKGVSWDARYNKWGVSIGDNYQTYFLGRFSDEVEAAKVYDAKAKELHKEFAYLNFPEQGNNNSITNNGYEKPLGVGEWLERVEI